jgi:hypothetical protein
MYKDKPVKITTDFSTETKNMERHASNLGGGRRELLT